MEESQAEFVEVKSEPTGPVSRLLQSATQLFASLITIAQTRFELFTTELREEIQRAAEVMLWAFIALFAAGIGLFLAALVTIFIFWDTHRVLASVLVTASFFAIALVAGLIFISKLRVKPRLLQGTLAELAKDREHLQRRL
jgi:uncharacterized membrane protein YqjE